MNDDGSDRTDVAEDEASRYDINRQVLLFCKLDEDLLLLTTSWLKSREATWLRSTSQRSCRLVIRNHPVSTADFAYFEAVTCPDVAYLRRPLEEHEHFNRFSPLRSWQFRRADIIMRLAPSRLERHRGLVLGLAVLKQRGCWLQYAGASLQSDREVVLMAVELNGDSLQYADLSFRSDREVVLAAVTRHGCSLQYAGASLQSDREVVLMAVKQNGDSLQYANWIFLSDREVVSASKRSQRSRDRLLAAVKMMATRSSSSPRVCM